MCCTGTSIGGCAATTGQGSGWGGLFGLGSHKQEDAIDVRGDVSNSNSVFWAMVAQTAVFIVGLPVGWFLVRRTQKRLDKLEQS